MQGGGVERMLERDEGDERPGPPALEEWLDYLEMRREVIIRELRHIDGVLVRHGRLNQNTLDRRTR